MLVPYQNLGNYSNSCLIAERSFSPTMWLMLVANDVFASESLCMENHSITLLRQVLSIQNRSGQILLLSHFLAVEMTHPCRKNGQKMKLQKPEFVVLKQNALSVQLVWCKCVCDCFYTGEEHNLKNMYSNQMSKLNNHLGVMNIIHC